jgi:hypothetical protein
MNNFNMGFISVEISLILEQSLLFRYIFQNRHQFYSHLANESTLDHYLPHRACQWLEPKSYKTKIIVENYVEYNKSEKEPNIFNKIGSRSQKHNKQHIPPNSKSNLKITCLSIKSLSSFRIFSFNFSSMTSITL